MPHIFMQTTNIIIATDRKSEQAKELFSYFKLYKYVWTACAISYW